MQGMLYEAMQEDEEEEALPLAGSMEPQTLSFKLMVCRAWWYAHQLMK